MDRHRGLRATGYAVLLLGLALTAQAAIVDADSDNMDDTWEQANGLNPTVDDAGDDLDSDTFSNLAEYRLGSNPQNPASIPPLLGNYFESFEGPAPLFWFSPGNPNGYDWVWNNTTASDGSASLVAANAGVSVAGDEIVIAAIVNVADSFLSVDASGEFYLGTFCSVWFGCGPRTQSQFIIRIDGDEVFNEQKSGALEWTSLQGFYLPAGEHLIEIVVRDELSGVSPNSANPVDYARIDAFRIEEATPAMLADTDADGLTDYEEGVLHGTDARNWDTDNDSVSDGYETANELNPLVNDAALDHDLDTFSNLLEFHAGTQANNPASVVPAVSAFTEDFDSFENGVLPAPWYYPEELSHLDVIRQPDSETSGWKWKAKSELPSQLVGNGGTPATIAGNGALQYQTWTGVAFTFDSPQSSQLAFVVNVTAPGILSVPMLRDPAQSCFFTLNVDGSNSNHSSNNNTLAAERVLVAGAHRVIVTSNNNGCVLHRVAFTLESTDSDGDGLTDGEESLLHHTDPADPDSDDDGLNDGDEVNVYGTDPLDTDSDNDGLSDSAEVLTHETNPNLADTDGDSVNDGAEVTNGLDPLDPADVITAADWDGDRYPNVIEQLYGTSAVNAADHPLPHPFIDGRLESFEAPFDTAVWSLGLWQTTRSDAIHGVRSLQAASTSSTARLTVNARAGTRLFIRFKNGSFYLKINGTQINWNVPGPSVAGWNQIAEPVAGSIWGAPGVPLATGVNVIEFTGTNVRMDEIRFAVTDADVDGMSDIWETENGLNPSNPADQSLDSDSDGFPALDELLRGTDPANPDTDDDGVPDGAEPAAGLNPLRPDVGADTDGDGLLDSSETLTHRTEPYFADTDYDVWDDNFEISRGFDPLSSTNDGLGQADSDADHYPDAIEVLYGTGPANANSIPPIPVYVDGLSESFEPPFDATPWYFGLPNSSWTITNEQAVDGSMSLRSHAAATTSTVIVANTRYRTNMHFRFRADDLVNRSLQVFVNGQAVGIDASGTGWRYGHVYGMYVGAQRIEFRYTGRAADKPAAGCDCVYIDAIQFEYYLDNDHDGISSAWESENGLSDNNAGDAALDTDNDGLTALAEYHGGSDPRAWDTDGDTLADGTDIGAGFNPRQNDLLVDNDNDGVSNAGEVRNGTDPNDSNSLPTLLGTYFESFEDASPPFWFSPGGSGPEDLDWQWTPLTATDGVASIVAATGPLATNRSPNVSMLITAADSFMSFDYSAVNNAAWPGCGAVDCKVNAEFSVTVDDEPMYVINPTGVIDWTAVGGVFLPAGEHLIEFGLTSPACVGAACSNAQADDVAQAWLDSLLIKPADPEDDTDSDGDGVADYDEVYQYHTDPMFPDIVCEDPANPPDGKLFNEDCDAGCHP